MATRKGFISESFDRRTMANMEVALDRALQHLAGGGEEHSTRRHIAHRILACARGGDKTLGGLTKAGLVAAAELSPRRAPRRSQPV